MKQRSVLHFWLSLLIAAMIVACGAILQAGAGGDGNWLRAHRRTPVLWLVDFCALYSLYLMWMLVQARQTAYVQQTEMGRLSEEYSRQVNALVENAEALEADNAAYADKIAALETNALAQRSAYDAEVQRLTEQSFHALQGQVEANGRHLEALTMATQHHRAELTQLRQGLRAVQPGSEPAQLTRLTPAEIAAILDDAPPASPLLASPPSALPASLPASFPSPKPPEAPGEATVLARVEPPAVGLPAVSLPSDAPAPPALTLLREDRPAFAAPAETPNAESALKFPDDAPTEPRPVQEPEAEVETTADDSPFAPAFSWDIPTPAERVHAAQHLRPDWRETSPATGETDTPLSLSTHAPVAEVSEGAAGLTAETEAAREFAPPVLTVTHTTAAPADPTEKRDENAALPTVESGEGDSERVPPAAPETAEATPWFRRWRVRL